MRYAVVDVETTGGNPQRSGITEIGIVVTDGERILDAYESLIRPDYLIPKNIQLLTGITPGMVSDAPTFAHVADDVERMLKDAVFVAQNVHFDLGFVQKAFRETGITYSPKHKLCTARYTRALFPGRRSYSLRNLCQLAGVSNDRPHRALSDAQATAEVLHYLIQHDSQGVGEQLMRPRQRVTALPMLLDKSRLDDIPSTPGVYFFKDTKGKVIYVGKAKDLRKRVRSHFSGNYDARVAQALRSRAADIHVQETGSELLAALQEDHEIRHRWPVLNRAQKENAVRYGIFAYQDQVGNWRIGIHRSKRYQFPIRSFYSLYAAREWLTREVEREGFTPSLCAVSNWSETRETETSEHNERVKAWMQTAADNEASFILKLPGPITGQVGLVWVYRNVYKGFGFVSDRPTWSVDFLESYIEWKKDSPTARALIERFRFQHPEWVHAIAPVASSLENALRLGPEDEAVPLL